jgi:hypothetical protein
MPDVSLDTSYASELVEFWAERYRSVKDELEQVKVSFPFTSHLTRLKTISSSGIT